MGLDMYLTKKHYVKNWDFGKSKFEVIVKKDGEVVDYIDLDKIKYVVEDAAYWRKANHVHDWFVHNVQDGEDDCKEYYVDRSQIEELVNLCETVLNVAETNKPIPSDTADWQEWEDISIKNKDQIAQLLSTQGGFFFGSTEYDGDYLYSTMLTIEQLKPLIEKNENGEYKDTSDIYYRSSW